MNFARAERKKEIIIVEGYMDMITIYQAGFKNVAASLGTAFSSEHAMLLKKFVSDIILVFDSDEAGERAALRAIPILSDGGFRVKVLQVPDGKDPDEYIKHNGPLEFGKLLINAVSFMEFQIKCARKKYSLNDLEQKMLFTKEAAGLISNLSSPIERDVYIKQVSEETGISMSAVEEEIYNTDKKRSSDFEKESKQRRVRSYTTGAQIKTESLHNARGVLQAQKNIISICCSNSSICRKLIDIVSPEEFRDKVFCSLLKYVYDCCLSGRNAVPADAVNIFADSESQAKAAEVFSVKFDIEDTEELEKALNEEIKLIKRVYLDYLASNASSIEEIQKVIELKKELGSFEFKL